MDYPSRMTFFSKRIFKLSGVFTYLFLIFLAIFDKLFLVIFYTNKNFFRTK